MMSSFNPPERQYYRVASGPCFDALTKWRKRRDELSAQYFAFAKSVGGVGFYAGHDDNVGNATAISAVTFEGDLPKGWKPRRWSSFIVKDGLTPAWPDQRTKVGREALGAIKALPLRPSTYGPCDEIGHPSCLQYTTPEGGRGSSMLGLWETMKVGWLDGAFYVALPKLNDEIELHEAKGYTVQTLRWTPLPGMKPILKEEMELDFARAKLREKEAA